MWGPPRFAPLRIRTARFRLISNSADYPGLKFRYGNGYGSAESGKGSTAVGNALMSCRYSGLAPTDAEVYLWPPRKKIKTDADFSTELFWDGSLFEVVTNSAIES
jgi:hypothetical protein